MLDLIRRVFKRKTSFFIPLDMMSRLMGSKGIKKQSSTKEINDKKAADVARGMTIKNWYDKGKICDENNDDDLLSLFEKHIRRIRPTFQRSPCVVLQKQVDHS